MINLQRSLAFVMALLAGNLWAQASYGVEAAAWGLGNADCARLLGSVPSSSIENSSDSTLAGSHLSDSARNFLRLIDVGLLNLGPEIPPLTKNLQSMEGIAALTNPFLNLRSQLGSALASRAEILLPSLDGDWLLIRKAVLQMQRRGAREIVERARNRLNTSVVERIDEWPLKGPAYGKFIGETEKYYFFLKNGPRITSPMGSVERTEILGVLVRVTKESGKVWTYHRFGFRSIEGREAVWIQNGLIYGITRNPSTEPNGWRVLRIDPELPEYEFSDYTSDEAGIFVRSLLGGEILFFAQRGRIHLEPGDAFKLEVYILDPMTLKLNRPHLVIDFPYSEERPGTLLFQAIAEAHLSPYPLVTLTKDLKTDGRKIIRRTDSQEWNSLRKGIEILSWPIDKNGNSNLEVIWEDDQGKDKSLLLPFSTSDATEHTGFFEPSGNGPTYIVGIFETPDQIVVEGFSKFQSLVQLWIVDQGTASYKSVQIVDRKPSQLRGRWEGRWTLQGEYLIRILSPDMKRIEIWQVDTENAKLFKVLDRSIPCGEDCAIDEVWVDWEKKSLVGWSTKEKIFLLRKFNLSNVEGQP